MSLAGPNEILLWVFLGAPVGFACILTVTGLLGRIWWVFDLTSHFRLQYLAILLLGALFFLLARNLTAAWASLAFALVNLGLILPLFFKPDHSPPGSLKIRLLLANILQANRSHEAVRALIADSRADIVALIETNRGWLQELSGLQSIYPYRLSSPREDNYGLTLLSRRPFERTEVHQFGPAGVPTLVANLRVDTRVITIVVTHPPPPKGSLNSRFRNRQLVDLARFANCSVGPLILCGDLNLTPWSPFFWSLLKESGLKDSTRGFGLQLTWPTDKLLLRVPIDHCLVSEEIQVLRRSLQPPIGSDHFPVLLDLAIRS